MVLADLDGDGIKEAVVSGETSAVQAHGGFLRTFPLLATVSGGTTFDLPHVRALRPNEDFAGNLAVASGPDGHDRVFAALVTTSPTQGPLTASLVTFQGKALRRTGEMRVPRLFALRSIADVDADGDLEAVGTNSENGLSAQRAQVIDVATGRIEWDGGGLPADVVGAGQLDRDPALELVLATSRLGGSHAGHVVDGAGQHVEWTYPDGFNGEVLFGQFHGSAETQEFAVVERLGTTRVFVSSPLYSPVTEYRTAEVAVAKSFDVNGDGADEIVIGRRQSSEIIALSPGRWNSVARYDDENLGGINNLAFGDLDGDGNPELINGAGFNSSASDRLRIIDAASLQTRFSRLAPVGPHSTVTVADLDLDGTDEHIHLMGPGEGVPPSPALVVRHAATGAEVTHMPGVYCGFGGMEAQAIATANIDADRQLEIILACADESVVVDAYDGTTLQRQWRTVLPRPQTRPSPATSLALVEGGATGSPTIAVTNGGELVLLDASGSLLWSLATDLQGAQPTLQVADFDQDGRDDVAFASARELRVIDLEMRAVRQRVSLDFEVIGQAVEERGTCVHVVFGHERLVRRDCHGAIRSTRNYGVAAEFVRTLTDSFGPLLLSDGDRLLLAKQGPQTTVLLDEVGPMFGTRNRGFVQVDGRQVAVHFGSALLVGRIELDLDPVFQDGFDLR